MTHGIKRRETRSPMGSTCRQPPGSADRGRLFLRLPWLVFLGCLLVAGTHARAANLFRIGTGGETGVYYPIGKLIALALTPHTDESGALSNGISGYVFVAQNSAGSVENVRAMANEEIEAGLVQADVAHAAFFTKGGFAGDPKASRIRAVASLYSEKLQMVTRADANIRSVADFPGKRISIDELGSGTLEVARIVLQAFQVKETDFPAVYLKPVFTHEKMLSGELDGFVMMAGAPMEAVTQVLNLGIFMVPIALETAVKISARHPHLVPGVIPESAYPGIPCTPTLQVYALLVVRSSLDAELVYQVTSALWRPETCAILKRGHPLGGEITLKTALQGISISLHPGAKRYYREKGMLQK